MGMRVRNTKQKFQRRQSLCGMFEVEREKEGSNESFKPRPWPKCPNNEAYGNEKFNCSKIEETDYHLLFHNILYTQHPPKLTYITPFHHN